MIRVAYFITHTQSWPIIGVPPYSSFRLPTIVRVISSYNC